MVKNMELIGKERKEKGLSNMKHGHWAATRLCPTVVSGQREREGRVVNQWWCQRVNKGGVQKNKMEI